MNLMLAAALAHEMFHVLVEGATAVPETADRVAELLERFGDEMRLILKEQLRADLLTTPPDDRDEAWRDMYRVTEEEN